MTIRPSLHSFHFSRSHTQIHVNTKEFHNKDKYVGERQSSYVSATGEKP